MAWVTWVCGWRGLNFGVGGLGDVVHKILAWVKKMGCVAWVHKILAWIKKKKCVSGVGPIFRVFGMGLRCFVKKILLKASQNLQKNICAGVSC